MIGIGSMFGAIGDVLFAASTGVVRVIFGFLPLLVIANSAYLTALVLLHLLHPMLQKVDLVQSS